MRVAVVSMWFSEGLGYTENCLPRALARQGVEVHVVTSDAQVYFNTPMYQETYEPYLGAAVQPCGSKELDGYVLHRLPHFLWPRHQVGIRGLLRFVHGLQPAVVQTFDAQDLSTQLLAFGRPGLRYKLFHEAHIHKSVFAPAQRTLSLTERLRYGLLIRPLGRLISAASERCYAISVDAADVAVEFHGMSRKKTRVCSLGVDTDLFRPSADSAERDAIRSQLGFGPDDIVCIYTGRFAAAKGPAVLARAVAAIDGSPPFRALFVGSGTSKETHELEGAPHCVVHPFVQTRDLAPLYRASDIGVWPMQESTSQIDAAACGLPLVLSDQVSVTDRIDGNGITYHEGDHLDLAARLRTLADATRRETMSAIGIEHMRENFSWDRIARERIADYELALSGRVGAHRSARRVQG